MYAIDRFRVRLRSASALAISLTQYASAARCGIFQQRLERAFLEFPYEQKPVTAR